MVQLGRYGDIANILPVAKAITDLRGEPTYFMVSKEFASILDGVSYVTPQVVPFDFWDLGMAIATAKATYTGVIVSQVGGKGQRTEHQCASFNQESWRLAGYLDQWGKLPLVFDRRNPERESALIAKRLNSSKPNMLVSLKGFSSPFPHKAVVWEFLKKFEGWNIVDLATFKCERIFDLVGLMDAANLLVTVDTAPLHLAHASTVPVIAFIRDDDAWRGSTLQGPCAFQCRYGEVPAKLPEIEQTIAQMS